MTTLEIRSHSLRQTSGGSQLSQEGVTLAREVGSKIGPFDRVVTSVLPRTRETAIAMGYAVEYELTTLAGNEVFEELQGFEWGDPSNAFPSVADLIAREGHYARFAHAMAGLWRDILTPLADHQSALFVGHSGELEAALVACFPNPAHAEWGHECGPLEGARIEFSGEPAHYRGVEILRLSAGA